MIVIFTTTANTFEEVIKDLGGVNHNNVYGTVKGVTIYKISEIINDRIVNLAYVNNADNLSCISGNLKREYVYNPHADAYNLNNTYTAVAIFLPEGTHIYT